jgi:phosphoglycerol transferase MdoB-like AlkP superfamily enzyme
MYGVSDHIMFERAVQEFSELSENGRSFFSAIVTTSNHGPYVIPAGIPFKPKANPIERQAVEYSDWAIGYFMKLASRQPWFDSTVFIFTADHGANVGLNKFDIPLSFHHIPFIVYCPLIIKSPLADKKLGGQIDIFPTVMGILNQSYINNTFGINLMKDSRPYIYFTEDNKMACLNDTFLYVYSKDKSEQLYLMSNSDAVNIIGKNREKAALMKTYMFSMLQTSQWMIEHKKTGYIPLGR